MRGRKLGTRTERGGGQPSAPYLLGDRRPWCLSPYDGSDDVPEKLRKIGVMWCSVKPFENVSILTISGRNFRRR